MRFLRHHDHPHDQGGGPAEHHHHDEPPAPPAAPGHVHDHDHPHDHEHPHHDHDHGHQASRRFWGGLAGLSLMGLAIVVLARMPVIVDQTEWVYITEFGKPVRLIEQPGLHWKWPYQSRRGFDRRLQLDTPPAREMLTRDKKNLQVSWYVGWRITDVDQFLRSVRTVPDASARLEDLAASVIAADLGEHDLAELVQVGAESSLSSMAGAVTTAVREQASREYGLEVVDVRFTRLNYPQEVRTAVFEQIRSERKRVAAATRAEGESQARLIRSAADREKSLLVARAEADAARLVGEGEAQATRIANEAHAVDPAFYQFLKTIDAYKQALDGRTTLVLSADSPFLKLLMQGLPDLETVKPSSGEPELAAPGSEGRPAASARAADGTRRPAP